MKKITFLFFAIIFSVSGFAQVTFQKTYGDFNYDNAAAVFETNDGGYIIGGQIGSSGPNGNDIYIIRINSNGDTLWTKTIDHGTPNDWLNSMQQTTDGGYILAGQTGPVLATSDAYLEKTDSSGNVLWLKVYGGASSEWASAVIQTADGGYIMTGTTKSYGAGNDDCYLIKTDANGDSLWTKTYGGTGVDRGWDVFQKNDGGYIIAATTNSFGIVDYGAFIISTDSMGNVVWSKTYEADSSIAVYYLRHAADGGFIFCGTTQSFGNGSMDLYLLKTDSAGTKQWAKVYGNTGAEYAGFLEITPDGGYIFGGSSNSFGPSQDMMVVKTDSSGNLDWTKTYGSVTDLESARGISMTTDGGYIIVGITYGFGTGYSDVYLVKTDNNGNSGCYEANNVIAPVVDTVSSSTMVTPVVSSGGLYVNFPVQQSSGGAITTLCSSVGVHEAGSFTQLAFYPNPVSNELFIANLPPGKKEVTVCSIPGEKILSKESEAGEINVNVKNLPSGIYFVKVKTEKEERVGKFVKE